MVWYVFLFGCRLQIWLQPCREAVMPVFILPLCYSFKYSQVIKLTASMNLTLLSFHLSSYNGCGICKPTTSPIIQNPLWDDAPWLHNSLFLFPIWIIMCCSSHPSPDLTSQSLNSPSAIFSTLCSVIYPLIIRDHHDSGGRSGPWNTGSLWVGRQGNRHGRTNGWSLRIHHSHHCDHRR